jgi:PAS domain S-box-containing protein
MINNLLRKAENLYDFNSWLDWLADVLTLLASFILPISFIFALPIFIARGNYFLISLDIVLWILCLLRAFVPGAAKYLPHVIWLLILYVTTISLLITLGPSYARSAWMILCAVIAAIIYRVKGAIISSALNFIILLVLFFFYHPTSMAWSIAYRDGLGNWLMFVTSLVLISICASIPVGFLISLFDRSLQLERKTKEKLQESERLYRFLTEKMSDILWIADINLRTTYISPSVKNVLGFSQEERMRQTLDEQLTPDSLSLVLDLLSKELAIEKQGNADPLRKLAIELEYYHKNGSTRWIDLVISGLRNDQGILTGIHGVSRDITKRKQAEEKLQQSIEILKKEINTAINVLVAALEARDPYTAGHQSRSSHLASAIATEMGLTRDIIDGLRMAGAIHDIGKLAVPTEILSKPTKLTNLEFSLIKEHSKSGFEMLKDVESIWPLAKIVYQHHERMNGTGYPRNLKGEEILLEARILAVADVVEAMASHRPYRASLGIEAALEEIEKYKGSLYDDAVVDACLRLFRKKGYQLT